MPVLFGGRHADESRQEETPFVRNENISSIVTDCGSWRAAQTGLVIVPMFGTHATKHRYEPYQPLVRRVPKAGINSVQ
ncbi:MAG: hypothetical protein SPI30_03105 [Prevotella sp.]|nr:hypothetical protein [Prevotella sp.]